MLPVPVLLWVQIARQLETSCCMLMQAFAEQLDHRNGSAVLGLAGSVVPAEGVRSRQQQPDRCPALPSQMAACCCRDLALLPGVLLGTSAP